MNDDDPSTTHLPALPEFEPAPDLWARIERRHVRRRRQRRLFATGGITSILVAAVAMFTLSAPLRDGDLLAQQRHETMQLEQDWQVLGQIAADSGYARLRPFDVALQQAYDRQAEVDELDQLWRQRNQVLRDLILSRQNMIATAIKTDSLISI